MKAKLASKDYSELEKLVSYEDYAKFLIEKETSSTPEAQSMKKMQDEIAAMKKAQDDELLKSHEAAVEERRKAVKALVDSKAEFSTIKELDQSEAVVTHILETFKEDGKELSPEEAAKEVEDFLIERAKKFAELTKIKGSAVPVAEDGKPIPIGEAKSLPPLKPAVQTLTNNMTSSGAIKRPLKPLHNLPDSERWAEARRRVEEKLQQGR